MERGSKNMEVGQLADGTADDDPRSKRASAAGLAGSKSSDRWRVKAVTSPGVVESSGGCTVLA